MTLATRVGTRRWRGMGSDLSRRSKSLSTAWKLGESPGRAYGTGLAESERCLALRWYSFCLDPISAAVPSATAVLGCCLRGSLLGSFEGSVSIDSGCGSGADTVDGVADADVVGKFWIGRCSDDEEDGFVFTAGSREDADGASDVPVIEKQRKRGGGSRSPQLQRDAKLESSGYSSLSRPNDKRGELR